MADDLLAAVRSPVPAPRPLCPTFPDRGPGSLAGPAVPPIVHRVLRGTGRPLDAATRSDLEPRLGTDLGHVRIHTGALAARSARAVAAHAYTVGDHVVFGASRYAPNEPAGRRLLLHELLHTTQGASAHTLRREPTGAPPEVERKVFIVKIPPGISTRQQLLRYAEIQVFGRVLNLDWDTSRSSALADAPGEHVGKPIRFRVSVSSLEAFGRPPTGTDTPAEAAAVRGDLPPEERSAMDAEVDRRYYAATQDTSGQKIAQGEKGKAVIWKALLAEVLADRKQLQQLPEAVKAVIGSGDVAPEHYRVLTEAGEALSQLSESELSALFVTAPTGLSLTAADYGDLLRVARKLAALRPEVRKDYLGRVNAATTSLREMADSIDRYTEFRAQRQRQFEGHESAARPLLGAEDLYTAYRGYRDLEKNTALARSLKGSARDKAAAEDAHQYLNQRLQEARADLLTALGHRGFDSIAAFEVAVESYRVAFRTQAVNLALDVLARYEHMLFEERQKLQRGGAVALAQGIAATSASTHFADYRRHEQTAASILAAKEPKETWWIQPHREAREAATTARDKGEAEVIRGSGNDPLVSERGVDLERLAGLDAPGIQAHLTELIDERTEAAHTARAEFAEDPDRVFRLPDLVNATHKILGSDPNTVYGRIIRDHIADEARKHLLSQIALGALAIALTFLVPGGGWLAAAAMVAQAGISTHQAYTAYQEYQEQQRDWELGFLAEEPSLFWVGLAITGAALDIGVAATVVLKSSATALKSLRGPLLEFSKDADLTRLAAKVEAAEGLDRRVQLALAREAKASIAARGAWRELVGIGSRVGGFAGLVDPGVAKQLFRALYHSVKRGINTIVRLSAEAKFLDIAGDLTRMSGVERSQLEAAFEEVKHFVSLGEAKGMDERSLVGFIDRWAINRAKPGFRSKLAEEMNAWRPLTAEQSRALNALDAQKRAVATLYDQRAAAEEELAALRAKPDRTPEDIAEIRELEAELRTLDPATQPGPRPAPRRGKIAEAEATLAVREVEAARARLTLYDRLRAAAPSEAAKARALRGALADQVGQLRKPPTKLQADHIVSVREVSDMDGFADLPWKDQKAIVDMRENLVAMDGAANASKGDRTWRSWSQASSFYAETTIEQMVKREAEVRALIQRSIKERLAQLPPAPL